MHSKFFCRHFVCTCNDFLSLDTQILEMRAPIFVERTPPSPVTAWEAYLRNQLFNAHCRCTKQIAGYCLPGYGLDCLYLLCWLRLKSLKPSLRYAANFGPRSSNLEDHLRTGEHQTMELLLFVSHRSGFYTKNAFWKRVWVTLIAQEVTQGHHNTSEPLRMQWPEIQLHWAIQCPVATMSYQKVYQRSHLSFRTRTRIYRRSSSRSQEGQLPCLQKRLGSDGLLVSYLCTACTHCNQCPNKGWI